MASLRGQSITGDSVRLVSDERLDIPDALALQSLIFETSIRTLGGLLGGFVSPGVTFYGCLVAPAVSWNGGTLVATFGPGLLLDSGTLTSPSGAPGARVLRHDPTLAGQTSTLDLTSYSPATQCLVWARRTYTSVTVPGVPAQLDTRRWWSSLFASEKGFSTYTRFVERVEWAAAPATITAGLISGTPTVPSGSGWFPVFRVTWSAGTPSFDPINWSDGIATGSVFADGTARGKVDQADGSFTSYAMGYLLRRYREHIAYIRDQTGNTNWNDDISTYRGLKQLDTDLTTAEGDITTLQGDVAYVTALAESATALLIAASFSIYKNGGSWEMLLPTTLSDSNLSGWSYDGTGEFSFTISSSVMVPTGYVEEIYAPLVTLNNNGGTAPTVTPAPTVQITNSAVGTFNIKFWSGGSLTDPDVDGFAVVVTGRRYV